MARSRLRTVLVSTRGVEIVKKIPIGPRCMVKQSGCLALDIVKNWNWMFTGKL
ncbi:MAG: hypothetical protein O7C75_19790 [Verrucomicrobia bacterium]|nr:hypothetical protein [Verrucomicrobiota bacterium]